MTENRINAVHIEHGFLLAGKRSVRKIFRSGRRAHGDGNVAAVAQPLVEFADFLFELSRERRIFDPAADFRTGSGKRLHIINIERLEAFMNAVLKTAFAQEEAEGLSRRGEAVGNADAGARKLAEQLAERGVLAADAINVRHAKLAEGENVATLYHFYPLDGPARGLQGGVEFGKTGAF